MKKRIIGALGALLLGQGTLLYSEGSNLYYYAQAVLYAGGIGTTFKLASKMGEFDMNHGWHCARIGLVAVGTAATCKSISDLFNPQTPSINSAYALSAGLLLAGLYSQSIPYLTQKNIERKFFVHKDSIDDIIQHLPPQTDEQTTFENNTTAQTNPQTAFLYNTTAFGNNTTAFRNNTNNITNSIFINGTSIQFHQQNQTIIQQALETNVSLLKSLTASHYYYTAYNNNDDYEEKRKKLQQLSESLLKYKNITFHSKINLKQGISFLQWLHSWVTVITK